MTRKDENITLGIILCMVILVLVGAVIACIDIGFAEYIARLAYIIRNIRIIC